MKKYTEIFDEIVNIMRDDSSTCKDMGSGPHEQYRIMIYDILLPETAGLMLEWKSVPVDIYEEYNFDDEYFLHA